MKSRAARRGALVLAASLLVLPMLAMPAGAAGTAGETLVTVTGAVGKPNRPPFDGFTDGFFAHLGVKFDKAHGFSYDELAGLGMVSLKLRYPGWPREIAFRGPRLRDVLKAAGASGQKVSFQALDGYEPQFDWRPLQGDDVLLAIEADGKPLSVGGRGPAWLVFPPGAIPGQDPSGDGGLSWAVFHINVE